MGDEERAPIRPLPPEMVERIAAGEVIERPASVVRELLENALDAGATSIRVELREGGLRLIRVADDGWGIPPDELELASRPHTTSKVRAFGDLERLRTLGFRGEALPSIAGVADLELASACAGADLAATVALHVGEVVERGVVARPRGTTVAVHDLFAGVPARRALLRRPRIEAAHALQVVRRYALAHPAVRLACVVDGRLALQTPGADLHLVVAAIYGVDAARALLPLGARPVDDATLGGFVSARAFSFPTREHVLIAVNGRPVANRVLAAAAEGGYRPALRKGRHPLVIALLDVEPGALDSNVHPAKAEVLLREERALAAVLREAVHRALGAAPTPLPRGVPAAPFTHFARPLQLRLPAPRRRRGLRIAERGARYGGHYAESADGEMATGEALGALEPLAQFGAALILARSAEGHLYLVDQHRAHERVIFDSLLMRRERLEVPEATPRADGADAAPAYGPGQLLLEPLLVELSPLQAETLTARLEELRAIGLDCQPFGGSVFLVRSLPHVPGAAQDAASQARELVADAAEEGDSWLDDLCRSLACRSAVRRGQALSPEEQRALLLDLAAAAAPALCPHGSPLLVRFSRGALARAFEW